MIAAVWREFSPALLDVGGGGLATEVPVLASFARVTVKNIAATAKKGCIAIESQKMEF